jgi:IclR family pca regulon transcriptional regulator
MSLGYHVLSGLDLREIALPYLEELSRQTRHNVDMGILDGTEVIFIAHVKQRAFVNIEVAVGSRFKAYRTAMGRTLLAHIAPGEFKRLLQEIRKDDDSEDYIGSNGERLVQRLRAERREGYSLSDGEMYPGLRAAAAPVYNEHGEVDAAVAIVAFGQTCSMETLVNSHVPLLLETTRKISMSRGYMSGKRN